MIVSWRFSGVIVVGDVERVEVCGELERGGHQADKAGQEQQVDKHNNNNSNNKENYNNHHANMTKFQVKIAVNAEQEQRWVFEQVRADRRCWAWSEELQE